jgi:hypothetical protein
MYRRASKLSIFCQKEISSLILINPGGRLTATACRLGSRAAAPRQQSELLHFHSGFEHVVIVMFGERVVHMPTKPLPTTRNVYLVFVVVVRGHGFNGFDLMLQSP